MPACEYYCSIIRQIDLILPEIFGRNPFDMDKFPEIDFQVELFGQIVIRRFIGLRFGLRNQNCLYFQLRWSCYFPVSAFAKKP